MSRRLAAFACAAALAAPSLGVAAEPASWPLARATAPTDEPRLYVLAFSHADIDDVAAAVLGTALGVPFDFDPALQGKMDLHVEERLTPGQLTDRFVQALAAAGGAAVRQDGRLALMPAAKARRIAQGRQRSRDALDRYAPERVRATIMGPSVSQTAARPGLQAQALPTERPFPLWLAALLGAGSAFGAMWLGSRFRIGRIRGPAGRREAVIDYLMAREPVEPEVLADARRRADEVRQPLEQALNQMGRVSDAALVEAYAAVTGCSVWRPAEQPALTGLRAFGPTPDYMRLRGLVPIGVEPRRLTLAALDPLDDEAIAAASAAADRPVRILVGAPADVRQALSLN